MSIKKARKQNPNMAAAKRLRDELVGFAEEFDVSDPVHTEVALDTHISRLVGEKLIKSKKKDSDLHLDDVLVCILQVPETDELMESTRLFLDLISSYGGEPTEDDMEEAFGILSRLIETLNEMEGIDEADGQTRIKFN
jgi:hypothetical protein